MKKSGIYQHFAKIAPVYRHVRNLDPEPILAIRDILIKHKKLKKPIKIADIGAGTGRYTELLIKVLKPENINAALLIDISFEMLSMAQSYLTGRKVYFINSPAENLPLKSQTIEVLTVFNAIHHFDFKKFIREAQRILKPGGFLFIYTRTQEQNRRSIWGKFFPNFSDKEHRLFWKVDLIKRLKRLKKFEIVSYTEFEYSRISTMEELLKKAFAKHYSTFYFYDDEEYKQAIRLFKQNLLKYYDPEQITHVDENTLIALRKN